MSFLGPLLHKIVLASYLANFWINFYFIPDCCVRILLCFLAFLKFREEKKNLMFMVIGEQLVASVTERWIDLLRGLQFIFSF